MARKRTQKAPRYVKADKELVMRTFHPEMLEEMGRLRKDVAAAKRRVNDLSKGSETLAEAKGKDWRDTDWFTDASERAEAEGDSAVAKKLERMANLLRQVEDAQGAADAFKSEYDVTVSEMLGEVTASGMTVAEFCKSGGKASEQAQDGTPKDAKEGKEASEGSVDKDSAERKTKTPGKSRDKGHSEDASKVPAKNDAGGDEPADDEEQGARGQEATGTPDETLTDDSDAISDDDLGNLFGGESDGAVTFDDAPSDTPGEEHQDDAPASEADELDEPHVTASEADEHVVADDDTPGGEQPTEQDIPADDASADGSDIPTDEDGHAVMTDGLRDFVKEHGQSPVGGGDTASQAEKEPATEEVPDAETGSASAETPSDGSDTAEVNATADADANATDEAVGPADDAVAADDESAGRSDDDDAEAKADASDADDTGVLRIPTASDADADTGDGGHDLFDTPLDEPDDGEPAKDVDRAMAIDTMTPDPAVSPVVNNAGGKFPAYVMVDENGWFHVEPYAGKFGRKKKVVPFKTFQKAMRWAFGSDAVK